MSNALPSAFISHSVPGRVRIRIPAMRHQSPYFERVRERLATVAGLHRLTTNTRTASVLLEYEGEIEPVEQIGERLELFALEERPHRPSLTQWIHAVASQPDALLKQVTDGRVDATGVAALALAGMGISQIVRGQALPAGLTLLWNASDLIRDAGKPKREHE